MPTKMQQKAAARLSPVERIRKATGEKRLDGIRGHVIERAYRRSSKHALNDIPLAPPRPPKAKE